MSGQVKMQEPCGSVQNATALIGIGEEKQCSGCGKLKKSVEFYRDKRGKAGGLYSTCKACYNAARVLKRSGGRTVLPGQCSKCGASDRYANGHCRPCARKSNARCRMKNVAQEKARRAEYYVKNADRLNASNRRWNVENQEKVAARKAKYRMENADHEKERAAKWQKAHPENYRAAGHRRRVLKQMVGGSFSAADIRTMMKHQKGKCAVCRANISKSYHIDHIMPLALGGSNGTNNIQLLCPFCNMSKHDKHPVDFMQSGGFLL